MTLFHSAWHHAKIGKTIAIGPIAFNIRFSRAHKVTGNWQRRMRAFWSRLGGRTMTLAKTVAPATPACAPPLPLGHGLALIMGTGPGLGSALARRFAQAGMNIAVAARDADKLAPLISELRATGVQADAYGCDATNERSLTKTMGEIIARQGVPDLTCYNIEHFVPGTLIEIETTAFEECWKANCLGAFLTGREVARAMLSRGSGTIIFTGATGSVRGRDGYINLAVGKFGARALSQSMARELGKQGIHVAFVILDGGILSPRSPATADDRMSSLFPTAIADSYYHLHMQHRSAWTQELDLRPWVEKF
jgi:NAD(P)-dependent dehydrogenase (short-subunit alcohol dehydrogenase family)